MKTVCIYHSIDLDGWMSAAIVKHWWLKDRNNEHFSHGFNIVRKDGIIIDSLTTKESNDELHFIGYNYGQPIPDLLEYDRVIMCDSSFDNTTMFNIVNVLNKELIWIDHHISAIKDCIDVELVEGLRDTRYAACELTWSYFFDLNTIPEIVRLLGRYDCFGHKGTDEEQKVLEFQYGARQVITNYEEAYEWLVKCTKDTKGVFPNTELHHQIIWVNGKTIYAYLCTEAKQTYKNGFTIMFKEPDSLYKNPTDKQYLNRSFICINKERFNPINFGIDYHKDGYDGAACFHYANDIWNFSLYNDNGLVDCSAIAKQYGGGGHKGAAGFKIVDLSLIFT